MSAVDPTQLTPAKLATLLTKAGGIRITAEQITADLDAGAPSNADGTVHLVHYTAWLVTQIK